MNEIEKNITTFERLGRLMVNFSNPIENIEEEPEIVDGFNRKLEEAVAMAKAHNGWFTEGNVKKAISEIGKSLNYDDLKEWLGHYPKVGNSKQAKTVAVIMAGNVPLVGFHDYLCVLLSGNNVLVKSSSDDRFLLPVIHEFLVVLDDSFDQRVRFTSDKLMDVDAVIATGSNNTSRYFEYYFGKYPNIIRKNRTSVAVLDGNESEDDLKNLGTDIFQYFGLGCRNVSKLYLPEGFDLDRIFGALFDWSHELLPHNKYYNNYEYHKAIYLLNDEELLENGFLLLRKNNSLHSPVAVLNYEFYNSREALKKVISKERENIQCVVTTDENFEGAVLPGNTQKPRLWDYADGVDTMKFLLGLN